MMYLYVGAVLALRNPRAHAIVNDGAQRALEVLGYVSFLCHSLDRADLVSADTPALQNDSKNLPTNGT